jgi:hypothetical protein
MEELYELCICMVQAFTLNATTIAADKPSPYGARLPAKPNYLFFLRTQRVAMTDTGNANNSHSITSTPYQALNSEVSRTPLSGSQ